MQFSCSARSLPAFRADYFPPLGDGQGYTGLELLLLSLAACSATSIVSMLRRMKKQVVDLRVNASGIRREQHPTSFSRIDLAFTLTSPDSADADLQKAIQLSAETYLPGLGHAERRRGDRAHGQGHRRLSRDGTDRSRRSARENSLPALGRDLLAAQGVRSGRGDANARERADRGARSEIHHPVALAAADHLAGFFRMPFGDQDFDDLADAAAVVLQLDAGLQFLQSDATAAWPRPDPVPACPARPWCRGGGNK